MQLGALMRRRSLYGSPAAVRAYRLLRAGAGRVGLQLVLRTFYSPIPELAELPADAFDRRSALSGVDFDLDAQLAFARGLRDGMAEFAPVEHPAGPEYARGTESYPLLDATVLYAMVRRLRPRRVLELGSGASTLVTAQALAANGQGELEVYDPYPGVAQDGLRGLTRLERRRAQDVPLAAFERLGAGDVLFVDTTHTVKLGSDVNFVVLEVLPRLAPDVAVHFHDIFLPYEYPRRWLEDYALYWSEQYLLQAFLSLNAGYEVLLATHALARERGAELAQLLPAGVDLAAGGSFWIRRRSA
jgi:Methyltransferase domain